MKMQPRTQTDLLVGIQRKLGQLDRRLTRLSGGRTRGSSAERDLQYGVPSTDAERAALANRQPLWLNTDSGWQESYYATTGLSGLTARGLRSGFASGWYPVGPGPFVRAVPTATFLASGGAYVGGWTGSVEGHGVSDFFTVNSTGLISLKRAGVYDVSVWTTQQQGSGVMNYHLRNLDSVGNVLRFVDGLAMDLNGGLYTHAFGEIRRGTFGATEQFGLWVNSGSANVHMGASGIPGEFTIAYQAPPLVTF